MTRHRVKGDKYRPVVTVLKVKKGVPTVIRVSGREYILRAEGQFNQTGMRRNWQD